MSVQHPHKEGSDPLCKEEQRNRGRSLETGEKGSKAAPDPGMKGYTVMSAFKKLRQEGCSQFAQGQFRF